jgi:SAM-dependent methyltransferase
MATPRVFRFIEQTLRPRACATAELIYDDMPSQSNESLPVIYRPFDPDDRAHWSDRGCILDFLFAARCEGATVLDIGPGDGWPSLLLAPDAEHVTGVDASARRVDVCRRNADRLHLRNATFEYVPPGSRLLFDDASVDAVTAASAIEQTPDPRAMLREIARVLKPGGRFRLRYEDLEQYGEDGRLGIWLQPLGDDACRLLLYDRHIERELVHNYALTFDGPASDLCMALGCTIAELTPTMITEDTLESLRSSITDAAVCTTMHPSGRTWRRWAPRCRFRRGPRNPRGRPHGPEDVRSDPPRRPTP